MTVLSGLSPEIRQYLLVTGNYWAFTLTDGALRMLVVLHFHQLGYSPLEVALLFVFYELFGVVTNLLGGWFGARLGLNATMNVGLFLQVVALSMLLVPPEQLAVVWVMSAQALSGVAKDLNKTSAKSAIKTLVPTGAQGTLFKWVALLTGSKNALKGLGFFLGGVLLASWGFRGAVLVMAIALSMVWLCSVALLKKSMGRSSSKPKFRQLLSKSRAINSLSAARLFLFAARDVWFVVALPVYLSSILGWSHQAVGGFLACWVIGYGVVQTMAPRLMDALRGQPPNGPVASRWAALLALVPGAIALAMTIGVDGSLLPGILIFGVLFAVNSSVHSYLIVSYAREDGVSLDVGFYYMANAAGRLLGTVLSGWVYQTWGLVACLWISTVCIALAAIISLMLPGQSAGRG